MKFTTLFTLAAASTAAFALPYEKRGLSALDVACAAAVKKEFSSCISTEKITLTNLDSICSAYNSDKCQDLLNSNSLATKLACGDGVKSVLETIKKAIKLHISSVVDLKCAKDEDGKTCPISNYVIENGNLPSDSSDQKWQDAVTETGKSKACSESFTNYANNYTDNADGASAINDIVGGDLTPTANTDVLSSAADTIKKVQSGATDAANAATDAATGAANAATDAATGAANAATDAANGAANAATDAANGAANAAAGAANGAANAAANAAGNSGNVSTSDATTLKASLAFAVVFALSALL